MIHKLAMCMIHGVGEITAKKLIAYTGSPKAVFEESQNSLMKIPGIGEILAKEISKKEVLLKAEKELKFIEKHNITAFFYLDKEYPYRLKECEDSPIILFHRGKMCLDAPKIISIVGTRQATPEGCEFTFDIVKTLAEGHKDMLIVSGLAYGIDIVAHRSALKNQLNTVAVLAHGLDRLYPPHHKQTATQILDQGATVTDFPSQTIFDKGNFIKRNRIIAGLADATIVVESDIKGGALLTAEFANSYNRDVFAIPGKPSDKFHKGCNWLIKTNKAGLMDSVIDLEKAMNWESNENQKPKQRSLVFDFSPDEQLIVDTLKNENELSIDFISVRSQLPINKVSASLLNLEFQGVVKTMPGKIFKLI